MTAPDRQEVARSIAARIDWTPTVLAGGDPRVSIVEQVLRLAEYEAAAEVRALRAELETRDRHLKVWQRGYQETSAGARAEIDRITAALAARTPQPAVVDAVRAELYEFAPPPWEAINYEVHAGGELLFEALGERSHEENSRIADVVVRFFNAVAPLPAVPDGEDATCSCCNGDPLTVCAACEQHSCWAGRFMCDESRTAGTKQASPSPNREDDDRPVRWAWAAWLAESAEQADDLDDSERHGLRIAATHLLEDDIAARLNPGGFDPVADPAWALRFTARLWADVETGRAARRVSAPPDGEDVPARLDAAAERHEDRWAVFCGDPSDAEDIVNVFDDRFEAEELAQRVIDARVGHRRITITEPAWMILACCGACGAVLDGEACCDGRLAEIEAGEAVLAENAAVAAALAARPTEQQK